MNTTHSIPTRHHRPRRRAAAGALALIVAAAGLAACGDDGTATGTTSTSTGSVVAAEAATTVDDEGVTSVGEDGTTTVNGDALVTTLSTMPLGDLSDAERDALLYMREEEKLAYDVYVALGDVWGTQVFSNIADAERTHTDSVKVLLDRYGITDVTTSGAAGVFTDPKLQELYDQLVATGTTSLVDALSVGATIEDVDIADLRARATDNPDIQLVYDNLEKGSRNHLRAFVRQLSKNDATYTPTYISDADFDAIVDSPAERGHG